MQYCNPFKINIFDKIGMHPSNNVDAIERRLRAIRQEFCPKFWDYIPNENGQLDYVKRSYYQLTWMLKLYSNDNEAQLKIYLKIWYKKYNTPYNKIHNIGWKKNWKLICRNYYNKNVKKQNKIRTKVNII